jgi:hypothetical protein
MERVVNMADAESSGQQWRCFLSWGGVGRCAAVGDGEEMVGTHTFLLLALRLHSLAVALTAQM